jgi:hypothetical protein
MNKISSKGLLIVGAFGPSKLKKTKRKAEPKGQQSTNQLILNREKRPKVSKEFDTL